VPYQHREFELIFDACCTLSKQDIPEVEAVIEIIQPLLEDAWADTAQEMAQLVQERLDGLQAELDAERDRELIEDFVLALLGALELRLGVVLGPGDQSIVLAAAERLLSAGGASVAAPVSFADAAAAGLPQTGLGDLELALRGRVQLRRDEIGQLIAEGLSDGLPAAAIQPRLLDLLGAATATWLPFVADLWAYRWFNVGAFVGGRQAGKGAFQLFNNPPNGPDTRTTPFCAWVHHKFVPVSRVETQLAEFARAVRGNNIRRAIRAWPLLDRTDGSPTEFSNFFLGVGLPPYHGRCRTVARPA